MTASQRIEAIDESEIPTVVNLHNQSHNDHRTSEQWQWEWRGHHPNLTVYCVLKDGEKIIGTQGILPIYLAASGH